MRYCILCDCASTQESFVLTYIFHNRCSLQSYLSHMYVNHHRVRTEEEELPSKSVSFDRENNRSEEGEERLEPPREIVLKKYSLGPDMIGGWKPRKIERSNKKTPFPIRYQDQNIDLIISNLLKMTSLTSLQIVYLGPRKLCSFSLHENRDYPNPYVLRNRSISSSLSKNNSRDVPTLTTSNLKFDSDFQGGNLDLVIQRGSNEFDLFMRVDTNTQGHTNWYFFSIKNKGWRGKVKLNICNFIREVSLYQKGLKPFILSQCSGQNWTQGGLNIVYQRFRPSYYSSQDENRPNKQFVLSFQYDFCWEYDTVKFSYGVPYLYSQLLNFVDTLKGVEKMASLKSLSGLNIPVLKITSNLQEDEDTHKKVIMLTARVHPGESNSSFVMEGLLSCLTSDTSLSTQLKSKYIFYVIPMLNPDGVVAGNYRTSLFGKDLNRTYDQSRKYAFPETYELLQLAKRLKQTHKRAFFMYIDIHGHSSKKNIFMYGPDYSIQTSNYDLCRQLPKLMSNLSKYFRYYSCNFRISDGKSSTSRAIFNRCLDIPFSYTMQSSNGIFFDYEKKQNIEATSSKWRQIGVNLCRALLDLDKIRKIKKNRTDKIPKRMFLGVQEIKMMGYENEEEDNSEDKSDCDGSEEDLPEEILNELENMISQGKCQKRQQHHVDLTKEVELKHIFVEKTVKLAQSCNKEETIREQNTPKKEKQPKKQLLLPQILKQNKDDAPLFRSRKNKEKSLSLHQSSKRYAPPTYQIQQSCFIERELRPVIFIQQLSKDHKDLSSQSLDKRPSRREKALRVLMERLKTIK